MKEIIAAIRNFIKERFNLHEDKADEQEIIETIRKDVHFQGANLWTLVFAILIASIGLNVGSTAVIIGAMLISPLMGPIMGVGLAVGINDFDLLQKGIKNVTIAVVISIIASAVYFYITPIHTANSELLARTNPSLWDVFIAFFGGLAGIVAGTRTRKSNVIPGVAIATALMPPLCTAGFGLAMGKWFFMLGALYLFFINSIFICFATFLIVKHLRFHKKEFHSRSREKRVITYIWIIVTIAIIPSIYLAYRIVQRSIFEGNATRFVQREFHFPASQVVNKNFKIEANQRSIELLMIGQELPKTSLDSIRHKMPSYGLDTATKLIIHQGVNARNEIDIAQIKASLLADVFKDDKDTLNTSPQTTDVSIPDLRNELKSLYPQLETYSLTQSVVYRLDSARADTVNILAAKFKRAIPRPERLRLADWVKQRIKADSVKLLIE